MTNICIRETYILQFNTELNFLQKTVRFTGNFNDSKLLPSKTSCKSKKIISADATQHKHQYRYTCDRPVSCDNISQLTNPSDSVKNLQFS